MNKLFLGPGVLSSSPNRCFNDTPGSRYTFTTRPYYIVINNIKTIRYDILTPFCFSDYRDMVRATDLLENWVGQHAIPQIVLATCREKHSSLKTDVLVSSGHNHFLRCLVTVLNLPFQEITHMSAFGRFQSSPAVTTISQRRARNGKYPPVPGRLVNNYLIIR